MAIDTQLSYSERKAKERRQQYARDYYQRTKPATATSGEGDARLNKPVHFKPAPKLTQHERAQLTAELGCLRREVAQTNAAISHLETRLGAAA
jgi:hypothetical protein